MRTLVLHGRGSSPKNVEWLASPFRGFGEVIVPEFDFEVNEGVRRALGYDFDIIAGHSRGGLVALIAGAITGRPVVAVGAPADRKRQFEYLSKFPENTIQGKIFRELKVLPKEELEQSAFQYADRLEKVLLIHGSEDKIVEPDQSVKLCERLRQLGKDCELRIIQGMGHSPSGDKVKEVSEVITSWLRAKGIVR